MQHGGHISQKARTAEPWLNAGFVLLLLTLLLIHTVVFVQLNIRIIDSDQPFMWLGASDYAKGFFYEPRYYAQDYNTFMEALVGVPFMWLGLPVYYAVPLATHILFLFPFLFTAFYLFFHQKKAQALLVMALIICLPADYDLMTSLPRGFVTGLFFCSFFIINLLEPARWGFVCLNTLMAVAGYFVNPNSVVVSAPFLFYIFLRHYKNPRYYLATVPALFSALPLHLIFNGFYTRHPDYIMNGIFYRFSTNFFLESISNLDKRFAHISFFVADNSLALLLVLAVMALLLYRSDKKAFAAFLAFLLVVLFSFCSGKTEEGSTWAYMSFSRMYLGIPVFICLFLVLIPLPFRKASLWLICVPLFFAAFKLINLESLLAKHYDSKRFVGVRLHKLEEVFDIARFYKQECDKRNTSFLMVSNRFWLNTLVAYAGPALYDENYPETQETKLEKRYWVRNKNRDRVIREFVMVSSSRDLNTQLPPQQHFELEKIDEYGLWLVKNNTLKTEDFLAFLNLYENYD